MMLVVDETVVCPNWELLVGLRGESSSVAFVGGFQEDDFDGTFVEPKGGHAPNLPTEKLSKVTANFAVSRADSNKHIYLIDLLPRPPAKIGEPPAAGMETP